MLFNFLRLKYFEQNLRKGSIMKIIKNKIKKLFFIGAVRCAPSIPPSLLQSVITWISQHIGDRDLVLLKHSTAQLVIACDCSRINGRSNKYWCQRNTGVFTILWMTPLWNKPTILHSLHWTVTTHSRI